MIRIGGSLSAFLLLGLYGESGVGHRLKPFLGYEFAGNTAYTVGLVVDTHQSGLQMFYELLLSLSQMSGFFFAQSHGSLFESLECGGSVGHIVAFGVVYGGAIHVVVAFGLIELGEDYLAEFLKLLVAISCLFAHNLIFSA